MSIANSVSALAATPLGPGRIGPTDRPRGHGGVQAHFPRRSTLVAPYILRCVCQPTELLMRPCGRASLQIPAPLSLPPSHQEYDRRRGQSANFFFPFPTSCRRGCSSRRPESELTAQDCKMTLFDGVIHRHHMRGIKTGGAARKVGISVLQVGIGKHGMVSSGLARLTSYVSRRLRYGRSP